MGVWAPGFVDLAHLAAQRVTEIGWDVINAAVLQSAQIHSEQLNVFLGTFCDPIDPTRPQWKFRLPVAVEMQPLDGEDDSPVPGRGYDEYEIAFPLRDAGWAWGNNRKSRAKITAQEASDLTRAALQADSRWQRRMILTAILNHTQYNFADVVFGTLTIKPLANGDSDEYVLTTGEKATDNHYHAQAAAIDDANYPFTAMVEELEEHPDNMGDIVVYVPSGTLKTAVVGLADFVPFQDNPRIAPGVSGDTLAGFPPVVLGDKRLGWLETAGCYVVEWKALPASIMLALPTGNTRQAIGYRDEPEAQLQGLYLELNTADGNHLVQRLLRHRGFAVQNRTAAVVCHIGDAAYVVPSGYSVPQL